MIRVWALVLAVLVALGAAAWASDFVTMQGERTIYTVECGAGAWQGSHCPSKLVAGPRYRYRVLTPHSEVIFWTVGGSEPSGKFADCSIKDGRNWICKANADAPRSITMQMAEGMPIAGPTGVTRAFRAVPKWRWLLIRRGFGTDFDVPAAPASAAAAS